MAHASERAAVFGDHGVHVSFIDGDRRFATNTVASGGTTAFVTAPSPMLEGTHAAVFTCVRGNFLSLGVGTAPQPADASSASPGMCGRACGWAGGRVRCVLCGVARA